jgi:DNA-binding MarR family transcriptional regulator
LQKSISTAATRSVFVGRLLLPKLVARLTEAHDHALSSTGLTTKQASILLSCELQEANTPVDLASLHGLEVSSITRMVERLERKGLLKCVRNREDRRQVIVQITSKGRDALHQAVSIASQVARHAWKGVTKKERVVLEKIAAKVMSNLNHRGPIDQQN